MENQKTDPIVTTIKLTIDKPTIELASIYPPTESGSLAYNKPATVSSSIAPLFMHTAQAALDDNPNTYWSTGRNDSIAATIIGKKFEQQHDPKSELWLKTGWIEVDLGAPKLVTRTIIQERAGWSYSPITSFSIEYEEKGVWEKAYEGTTLGDKPVEVVLSKPVKASKFRLSIQAEGRPAIAEFQLFDK